MKILNLFGALLIVLLLAAPVMAVTNETATRSVMGTGLSGIMISLGLESVIPNDYPMYYNWIAVGMLFLLAGIASQRNNRFMGIVIVLFAAVLAFFGWLNCGGDKTTTWGMIAVTGLFAAAFYMKQSNKEASGTAGPGNPLINFAFYMILLQAAVGFVNTTTIWDGNTAATPSMYQFDNVKLTEQVEGISNQAGLLDGALGMTAMLITLAITSLKMIFSILLSITCFSVTLLKIFPFLLGNPLAVAFIAMMQVVVWLLYAWLAFTWFYKPPLEGNYI